MEINIGTMVAERRHKIKELEDEIAALEAVERIASSAEVVPTNSPKADVAAVLRLFRGKPTQKDAVLFIADNTEGMVRVKDIARMVKSAGLVASPRNAHSRVHRTLKESGRYEQVSPGVFQAIQE